MATSLDVTRLDWSTPAGLRDIAARCDGWAAFHLRRGGLADLTAADGYEARAAGARWMAMEIERKST